LRVIIPTLNENCPARLALETEGLSPHLFYVQDRLDYGKLLSSLWNDGLGGFILVEYDIVPWPTALQGLMDCDYPFCGYNYPMANGGEVGASLGCTKFSSELVYDWPMIYRAWEGVDWKYLDAHVIGAVSHVVGQMHIHQPPVAHARARPYGPDNVFVNPIERAKGGV
jgi:hypothetical protein